VVLWEGTPEILQSPKCPLDYVGCCEPNAALCSQGRECSRSGSTDAWAIEVIDWDRRVPFIRPALVAGEMQPALDIADLKHLILQNDLLAVPRA
jgi:hypothetical protein